MVFWGVEVKPGKTFTLFHDYTSPRLRITQATVGVGSSNHKSTLVQCNVGNKAPVLLCSLLPEKMESIHLDLEFQEAEDVTFSVIGPRSVHLTGYILPKTRHLVAADDESESYGEDVGDADTEVSGEVSDDDDYGGSFIDDGEPTYRSPSPSSSEEVKKGKKKKNSKSKGTRKRLKKKYELSESENENATSLKTRSRNCVLIDESDEDDQKPISSLLGNAKTDSEALKRKHDDVSVKKSNDYESDDGKVTRKNRDNIVGQITDDNQDNMTTKKLDIVPGKALDDCQASDRKVKKRKKVDDVAEQAVDGCPDREVQRKVDDVAVRATEDSLSNDRKSKKKKKVDDVAALAAHDSQSEDRKVKKKKRKDKKNASLVDTEMPSNMGDNEANGLPENLETSDLCTRTIFGGLVVEELKIGEQDGKIASSGRKVTVHYTGRLKEQGQVFDSTVGKSPLKFRLGKDDALDGLHLGIDGMRVGGKRRLVIPPELGFGSKGANDVPPNAWLVMDVELLKVR
ncbi:peptidyl-prolyl cis-trans isomerase FKBP43 [Silene latifolia]|uniref:peptidyl-prolyl cis-trans isomerase FKBP43 n=1 Tax=Silene latifolia TaxID=37657 RepID=UPI003D783ED7